MSRSSRARSRASACSSRLNSSGSMTFCSSDRPGIRLGNWKTKPMVRLRRLLRSASLMPHRSTPSTVTVPLVGVARPAAMFSRVVLPQPDRPVMTR